MSHRATLFLLLLLTFPLAGQQRIARIEVAGGIPASIVVSQSALVEGRSYNESDLDAAVARIRRLPFVYDARWTVTGETLRIEVTGMTRLFAEAEVLSAQSDFDDETSTFVGAGARQFFGSGVLEGRLTTLLDEADDTLRAEVAYSQYAIGGTRLFATLGADVPLRDSDEFEPDPTWALTVGYPLTVRQTVTASALRSSFESELNAPGLPGPVVSEWENFAFDLRWTYDTSDDPFFARRGAMFSAGHTWRNFDSKFNAVIVPLPDEDPEILTTANEGDARSLGIDARLFRPIGTRSTIFGGLEASASHDEFRRDESDGPTITGESDSNVVRLSLGFGHNFFDLDGPLTDGRHRIEVGAAATRRHDDTIAFDRTDEEQLAELAYLYRRRFATVRVSLMYGWD